jgi:hypothetical protein
MGHASDEDIRRRAFEIWNEQGQPHGRDREHWEQAARELGAPAGSAAAPKAGKKPAAVIGTMRAGADAKAEEAMTEAVEEAAKGTKADDGGKPAKPAKAAAAPRARKKTIGA